MLCLIPALFIAGMVVQSCKTGKGSDHRQGVQTIVIIVIIVIILIIIIIIIIIYICDCTAELCFITS